MKRFRMMLKKMAVISSTVSWVLSFAFIHRFFAEFFPHLIKMSPHDTGIN